MNPFKGSYKVLRWPWKFKMIMVAALWQSILVEYFLKSNKFNAIRSLHKNQPNTSSLDAEQTEYIGLISRAMKLLEKYAPWKPKCYNRALTAKKLLLKNGIVSTLHIGVRNKEGDFDGHAWLTYQDILVTGFVQDLSDFNAMTGPQFLEKY